MLSTSLSHSILEHCRKLVNPTFHSGIIELQPIKTKGDLLGHWAAGRWVKPFEKPWWTTEVPVLWGVSAFVLGPRGKAGKSNGKYGELRWVYVLEI